MGLQFSGPRTTLPSLHVTGNDVIDGTETISGNVGFYGHAPGAQAGPYTLAGLFNAAMALPVAAGVAATGATNVAAFGYTTAAQADAIVTAINALEADVSTLRNNVNAVITGLKQTGLFL